MKMPAVKTGYVIDARVERRKSGSHLVVCLKTRDGYEIIRCKCDYSFFAAAYSERAIEALEGEGFPTEKRVASGGYVDLFRIPLENIYFRAYQAGRIKQLPAGKRLIGSAYPFKAYCFIHQIRPYAPVRITTDDNGTTTIEDAILDYPLELSMAVVDIETDGLVDPKIADKDILRIGLAVAGGQTITYKPPEGPMLKSYFADIARFDVCGGWGSDDYDMPILRGRATLHGVDTETGRGLCVAKKRMGSSYKGLPVLQPFGTQNLDLMKILPRIYRMPTSKLDDARRVILGIEPQYMDKSRMKELAEKNDPALDECVRRDVEELADICTITGLREALVYLAQEFRLLPDELIRRRYTDIANHWAESLGSKKGVLHDRRAVFERIKGTFPFEESPRYRLSKFQYPPKHQCAKRGHYKGPLFIVDKRLSYPTLISVYRSELEKAFRGPVAWASERAINTVAMHCTSQPFSMGRSIAHFMKGIASHLPQLVMDPQYRDSWFYPPVARTIEHEAKQYLQQGLYNDWENMFTAEMPREFSPFDAEHVDGLVVFQQKNGRYGYVYAKKHGDAELVFSQGIDLSDKFRYLSDSVRKILYNTVMHGKEGLVDTFRLCADKGHMKKEQQRMRSRYSDHDEEKIRRMLKMGIEVDEAPVLSPDDCVRKLAARLEPVAAEFGLDADSLAAKNRQLAFF